MNRIQYILASTVGSWNIPPMDKGTIFVSLSNSDPDGFYLWAICVIVILAAGFPNVFFLDGEVGGVKKVK